MKKNISMGVELETYSIALPEYRVCRELHFPKRSIVEKGEKFTRDVSIGSEYNSRVFHTIRESIFLLKSSLRKYTHFRSEEEKHERFVIFPTGGWTDRFAGTHIHLASGKKGIHYDLARKFANHIHDHIPFLIVLAANSPVWREKITPIASNRLLKGAHTYCHVTKWGTLPRQKYREMTYNKGGKKKPPTFELRVCDSALPEYIAAVLTVCRAAALRCVARKAPMNRSTHANYLKARDLAIKKGVKARLVWNNHWMSVSDYVDIFFRKYEEELDKMDLPDEVLRVFKHLKKGWNQAEVIRKASERCRKRHKPTWQRQFAKKYFTAIQELLDGNSFEQFAARLGARLPSIERAWLGRKEARW